MKAHVYKMTCLTNMHVGNGDVNYSIIDNEVEKDPVFSEPVIPSSGVKGALLSFCVDSGMNETIRDRIFGNKEMGGTYKFLTAGLLARPARVTSGEGAYVLATSPDLLKTFKQLCNELGAEREFEFPKGIRIISVNNVKEIEGIPVAKGKENKSLETLLGNEPWAVLSPEDMRSIALPVTARNKLGEDKNLWYEEYVPHKSVFYLIVLTPEDENELDEFINNQVVQFGADASIGYGLIKIEKM